jgi:hypothetical protein
MPKILGNSSDKNDKSCRIFHSEFNKIRFAFFRFFYDFIRIFKVSAKLEETDLQTDPRISQTDPRDENLECNWVPSAMAGGGSSISARGRAGDYSGAHLRPISGVGRLRGRAGEGAPRHQPLVAAASSPPAKLRRGRANTRHWRLQGFLVKAARVPHGCGKEQEGELVVEALMADRDEQPALGTAGDLHSRPAPRLRVGVRARRNSAVQRRASVDARSRGRATDRGH